MTHIAMDVHKKRSVLAYQTPAQGEPQVARCYTTRASLERVLEECPRPWVVCLEATRQSPAVVRWLRELKVDAVQLVDPKGLKAFLKGKPKTDARDAKEMLALLQMGRLPKAYLAPPAVQELRALTRARQFVRRGSTSWRNQLRALLNQHGLEVAARDLCGRSGRQQLAAAIAELGPHGQTAGQELSVLLQASEQALDALDGQVREELAQQPVARALMTLPGIGPVMALALVAELGEIDRFGNVLRVPYVLLTIILVVIVVRDHRQGMRYPWSHWLSVGIRYWFTLLSVGLLVLDTFFRHWLEAGS